MPRFRREPYSRSSRQDGKDAHRYSLASDRHAAKEQGAQGDRQICSGPLVDTPELARKISECSSEAGLTTQILLQANTSGEPSKHGLSPYQWNEAYPKLLKLPNLKIEGLMTMAPLVDDQQLIRRCFSNLRLLRDQLGGSPALPILSMGMSHDYRIALEEGATHLRVGTAIFAE